MSENKESFEDWCKGSKKESTVLGNSRYAGADDAWSHQQKKIDERDARIAELEKIEERLKYNHMINEDAFFTNAQQVEKIKELQDELDRRDRVLKTVYENLGKIIMRIENDRVVTDASVIIESKKEIDNILKGEER